MTAGGPLGQDEWVSLQMYYGESLAAAASEYGRLTALVGEHARTDHDMLIEFETPAGTSMHVRLSDVATIKLASVVEQDKVKAWSAWWGAYHADEDERAEWET